MKLTQTVFLILLFAMLFACSKKEEPASSTPAEEVEMAEPVETAEPAEPTEPTETAMPAETAKPAEPIEPAEPEMPPTPVDVEDDKAVEMVEVVPGLEVKVLRTGKGRAVVSGEQVEVHYTGWIFDAESEIGRGTRFDSSVDRGELFQFPLGEGRVINGWDLGIEGMLVGEVRELKVAPELAYGDEGAGAVIPPGATLIFEIELFEISAAEIN
jgi:FKBP-type peptidyl-prolyl cis-trans isomerase